MLYPLTNDKIVEESNNLEQALFALRCRVPCTGLVESIKRYNRHNAECAKYEIDGFRFVMKAHEHAVNGWHP